MTVKAKDLQHVPNGGGVILYPKKMMAKSEQSTYNAMKIALPAPSIVMPTLFTQPIKSSVTRIEEPSFQLPLGPSDSEIKITLKTVEIEPASSLTAGKGTSSIEVEAIHPTTLNSIKGAASGVTVPLATIPLEKKQALATSSGTKKSGVFDGYRAAAQVSIPTKVASGILFMATASQIEKHTHHLFPDQLRADMVAYGGAAMVEKMATAPTRQVLHKMHLDPTLKFLPTLKSLVASEGIASLWRGNCLLTVSAGVQNILFFPLSRKVKESIEEGSEKVSKRQSLANSFAAGSLVSLISTPILYPFNRVTAEQRNQAKGTLSPPLNARDTAVKLVKTSFSSAGFKGVVKELYKGVVPSLAKTPLAGGVVILTCEAVQSLVDAYYGT